MNYEIKERKVKKYSLIDDKKAKTLNNKCSNAPNMIIIFKLEIKLERIQYKNQ